MSQQKVKPAVYFADTKAQATIGQEGPQPRFLLDSESLKVLVVGLKAGQQIPAHPESAAVYHFLEGHGTMMVDAMQFEVQPGATVITLDGAQRGVTAKTRLIFVAAKAT